MALGDSVGKQAIDEIDSTTLPEALLGLTKLLAPFAALIPDLQYVLQGKKRLIITLEDVTTEQSK